jgi:uncharacterized membrane protein YgaE (UPF0421/DUF939 family)
MATARDVPLRRLRLRRPTDSLTDRLWLLRRRWRTLLRLSLATSAAFFLATHGLGHQQAFFAPIAAVIVLIAGAGLRGRTLFELVLGVAIGVGMGELLVLGIGRGAWQMALIVVITVVVATLLGLKGLALTQSATSSVLLAAVIPVAGSGNPAITRFLDALVGGAVGLAAILLIPRNPVRDIDREVQRILTRLADILGRLAQALRTLDADLADQQLAAARDMQPQVEVMTSTAANVSEIARMSPVRWRQREHVQTYVATVRDLDNAVRDTRVLARKTSTLLRRREPVPSGMETAVDGLARAIGIFADDLSEQDDFDEAREALVEAAGLATNALTATMTINSATIAAQVRSLAADLLYASGYSRDEVDRRLDFS